MLRRQDIFGINIMQPEVFDNLGDDVGISQSVNLQPMCIRRMTKLLERNFLEVAHELSGCIADWHLLTVDDGQLSAGQFVFQWNLEQVSAGA